ncbi:MAG TPA: hypothetical protein VGM44_06575, partial [Polyangiaceae bacterium]
MAFDAAIRSCLSFLRARSALAAVLPTILLLGCQGNIGGGNGSSRADNMGSAGSAMVAPNAPCPVGQSLCG